MRSRRSIRDRNTKFSASFFLYSSNPRTLIARPARPLVARNRWPYVTAPEVTSCTRTLADSCVREIVYGTTRPPYKNNNHLMGRPNSSSPRPSCSSASQCICFGNGSVRRSCVSTSGNTSTVARPRMFFLKARYLPLGVSISVRAENSTPCFLAKPSAAGVGWPSAPNAAATGGPVSVSSRSSCRSTSAGTHAANRRGVPCTSIDSPAGSPCALSATRNTSPMCCVRGGSHDAGSSSTPISMSSSRSMVRLPSVAHHGLIRQHGIRRPRSGNGDRQLPDFQDVRRAFRHADAAARVEQVEGMRTLEAIVERRQHEPRFHERACATVVLRKQVLVKPRELALGHVHLAKRIL